MGCFGSIAILRARHAVRSLARNDAQILGRVPGVTLHVNSGAACGNARQRPSPEFAAASQGVPKQSSPWLRLDCPTSLGVVLGWSGRWESNPRNSCYFRGNLAVCRAACDWRVNFDVTSGKLRQRVARDAVSCRLSDAEASARGQKRPADGAGIRAPRRPIAGPVNHAPGIRAADDLDARGSAPRPRWERSPVAPIGVAHHFDPAKSRPKPLLSHCRIAMGHPHNAC